MHPKPASPRGGFVTSPTARWTVGRAADESSARPSNCRAKPIRASSSPPWTPSAGQRELLCEALYCARGEWRTIKECQLHLFADRTSTATMRPISCGCGSHPLPTCDARSAAPHRAGWHRTGRRHLREPAPETAQDRRTGQDQRAPHPRQHGQQSSVPDRMAPGSGQTRPSADPPRHRGPADPIALPFARGGLMPEQRRLPLSAPDRSQNLTRLPSIGRSRA